MDEIDLEDKKTQIILILLLFTIVFIIYSFFFQEDEYKMEIVKPVRPNVETVKKEEIHKPKKIVKEKIKVLQKKIVNPLKEEQKEIIAEEPLIEEKENVLFKTSSMSHMHNIKVISEITIEKLENSDFSFAGIEGNVINSDGVDGRFSISIREDYIEYLNQIYIEVEDKISKTTTRCDASFLTDINVNDFYQFDFDNGACYITDYKPESVFLNKMRENIKPVHNMSEDEFKELPEETQKKILERIEDLKKENIAE